MAQQKPIIYVDFPNRYLLTSTLLRFEEHYESPHFAGKVFSWEEYMDWYASTKGEFTYHRGWGIAKGDVRKRAQQSGNFTYFLDWSGFNIPSHAFEAFRKGLFDPLTKKEAAVVKLLADAPEKFYFIATFGGDTDTLQHEIVHGLFYCRPEYADAVRSVLAKRRESAEVMHRYLDDLGYGPPVFDDETNAYATTGWYGGMTPADVARLEPLKRELRTVFRSTFGFPPGTKASDAKFMQFVQRVPYATLEALKSA